MESCRNIYLLERSKEKETMQNIIDQIIALTTKVNTLTADLNKAQTAVVKLNLAKLTAETVVETKTATLYAEGKVEGSNETARKANLANLLAVEIKAVADTEIALITAKSKATVTENNLRAVRDNINVYMAILKVQSGVSEG